MHDEQEDSLLYVDDDDELDANESTSLLSESALYRQLPVKLTKPTGPTDPAPTIGLLGLTVLAYFSVSGGPFGLEVAIAAGGPARTLIALATFALFSALPSAMMTAELSSALPGRAGFVHWVDRGLSPRLGELNSFLSLLNTAVDASAYPGVCCDYVLFALRRWGMLHADAAAVFGWRAAAGLCLTVLMCAINGAGIKLATRTAVLLAIFSFVPFALMLLVCLVHPVRSAHAVGVALRATSTDRPLDTPLLLAVCLWSTSGFDSVSFVSSEVGSGTRTLPKAMAYAVLLMVAATALPILTSCAALGDGGGSHGVHGGYHLHAARASQGHAPLGPAGMLSRVGHGWEHWSLGSFSVPAEVLGGRIVGVWSCVAGAASSLGLLNAFMLTSARNVQAMAQKGLLPAVLRGERGKQATPFPALLFSTGCILLLTPFTFAELIELNMALYAASLLFQQLALLRLRWSEPELRRPFRIPLPRHWLVAAYLPQIGMCLTIIAFSLRTPLGMLLWACAIACGLMLPRFGPRAFGKPAPPSPNGFGAGRFDARARDEHD